MASVDEAAGRTLAPALTPRAEMALPASPPVLAGVHPDRLSPLRRYARQRRTLALADLTALIAAYGMVWLVAPPQATFVSRLVLTLALPLWVLLNKLLGLYDRDPRVINKSTLDELPRIAHSVVLGGALIYLLWPLIPGVDVGRVQTLIFIAAALPGTIALRTLSRRFVARTLPRERCLIVGSGVVAQRLAEKVRTHPQYGIDLVGFVDDTREDGSEDLDIVGDVSELHRLCRALAVDRVVIAFSAVSHEDLLNVVDTATRLQLQVSIVPRLFEGVGQVVEIDDVHGMTLHGLTGLHRARSSLLLKRAVDIVIAGVGLLVLSPVLLVAAILVKASSPGPILFRQSRIGRRDQPFGMFKFRTMHEGADARKAELLHLNEASGPMFKIADDPRITPIGRILRKYSIDELPQLFNILRGEMSVVGPRPLVPSEADAVIGRHRARLDLTPGLTGPWQVLGRTAIPFNEMVNLDYLYVSEWSLWNDIKLMARTMPVVVRGAGQ